MAPYAGRVRDGRFNWRGTEHSLPINMPPHAIHGTVYERAWISDGSGRLRADLGSGWPFAGHAIQEFRLDDDSLLMRLEVHAAEESFPANIGWHPWFLKRLANGEEAELQFEAREMYPFDATGIPTGEKTKPTSGPWDDCFCGLAGAPEIRWGDSLRLRLESAARDWVIYTEPDHALCVEPLSSPPNSINMDPQEVSPGKPLVEEYRLVWG